MAIKESSDELNPPEVVIEDVPGPQLARSPKDYLALTIATCGVGYIPLAPGTFGSLVGIGLFLLLQFLTSQVLWLVSAPDGFLLVWPAPIFLAGLLMLITIVILVGIWAGSGAERLLDRKDPQKVVIDEVAGQLIALIPVTPTLGLGWWLSVFISFLLFRFFDIIKPYPARQLEMLPAGLGIMVDDVVAGAYAAVATSIIIAALLISVT